MNSFSPVIPFLMNIYLLSEILLSQEEESKSIVLWFSSIPSFFLIFSLNQFLNSIHPSLIYLSGKDQMYPWFYNHLL